MVKKYQLKKILGNNYFLNKNRKGLSTIVITLILIVISMAAIVLVWSFASNLIKGQIKNSESCFGNYEKIKLNGQYTCYTEIESTDYSGTPIIRYNLRFSLSIGDIDPDSVIVGISSASATKGYTITNTEQTTSGLTMYPSGTNNIILPSKNAGLTYTAVGLSGKPDSIEIAPVMGGVQCDVSDSISQIVDCDLLDIG